MRFGFLDQRGPDRASSQRDHDGRDDPDDRDLHRPVRWRAAGGAAGRPVARRSTSTGWRARSSSPTTCRPTTRPATPTRARRCEARSRTATTCKSVRFLNRDEAYDDAIKKFPQYKDVAGKDAFPASFIVKLNDPEQHKEFDEAMVGQPGVLNVLNQKDLIDRLFAVLDGLSQRGVRGGVGAGDRRDVVDSQHGSSRRVYPANRDRHHATGRRQSLVHAVAVPGRGDAGCVHRRRDRDRRPDPVRALFLEKALNQFYQANLIARIDYADILYIAPILLFVGVAMAGVTGVRHVAAVRAEVAVAKKADADEVTATTRSSPPIAKRGTTIRSSRPSRPGSR